MIQTRRSVCSYCGTGCGIVLSVRDRAIVALSGDEAHPTNRGLLCSKGRELHHTVVTADRLRQPQIRTSRAHPFAPVDWDTVLDFAAGRFADIIRTHGPDAVAFYISGQLLTEDYYAFNKLMKGFIGSNNVDTNSRLCMSSAVVAYKRAFGADGPPTCYDDIERAGCFFIIGANPAWAHPIVFRRMEAAKEANPDLRVIVADPRRTDTASIADLHLPILPGTDIALMQAMLNVMLWEGLVDTAFIDAHTEGFEQAAEAARAMTPRKAAAICGLDAAEIVRAAFWFAENDTLSFWCQGLNQSTSGSDNGNALINLHLATGKLGKPGNGPFSLTGQSNAMGGREVGGLANMLAAHRDYTNPGHRREVADYWGVPSVPETPGLTATELVRALEEGRVKAVWIACTNPMVSLPDGARVEAALKKAELVMVSDTYHPTDTTGLAHVLFPAAGWGEKNGTVTNSERCVSLIQQALPAPGVARPDWRIVADFAVHLGRKLGQDWSRAFGWQTAEEVFDEHKGLTRGRDLDISGLSYRLLATEGPQQWPFPAGAKPGQVRRLYGDGRFETESGKARFVEVAHRPVAEPTDEDFPLSLTTGRLRDQWHTMTKTGHVPRLLQHAPRPALQIHPDDAAALGLAEGDLARVRSRRGEVIVAVKPDRDIRAGVVFLPMHWGALNARAGRANRLTGMFVDPLSKQPEFKHAAVRVERFEPAWQGMMLMAGERTDLGRQMIEGYTYGVVYCAGDDHPVTTVEMACTKPLKPAQYRRLDQLLEQGRDMETLSFVDRRHGIHRKAWLEDGRLVAVRWVGGDISEARWLRKLMLEGRDVGDLRPFLLAPGGPLDKSDTKGAIVCACNNVGEKDILAAIRNGADSLDAIKGATLAGTGCGSCVPEIKRLLAG